jgi:hypothetical protein
MAETGAKPALSDEVKDRIRLEEQFRLKIRGQQEEQENAHARRGVRGFFNSKLGIVVLSAILVPAVGGLYAHMQQRASERNAQNRQTIKLVTEFDWRIAEIEYHRRKIPTEPTADKWASAAYIWRAIVGDPAFIPTQPEFQRVHLAGIVSQLRSLGYDDAGGIAFKTIKDMESGGGAVPLPGQPAFQNHTYDVEKLGQHLAILKEFRSHVAPRTGFWGLIW